MSKPDATRDLIFAALKRYEPISTPELAKKLNMLPATVGWQIQRLRESKLVRIHSFSEMRGKTHTRIWATGDKPDAPRPQKFDRQEYYYGSEYDEAEDRRLSDRLRKGTLSDEQLDAINAARDAKRKRELAALIQPFRDPMIWALFGGVAA